MHEPAYDPQSFKEAIVVSAKTGLDIIEDEVGMRTCELLEDKGLHVVGFEAVGYTEDDISGAILRLVRNPSADVILVLSGSGEAGRIPAEVLQSKADSMVEVEGLPAGSVIGRMSETFIISLPYDINTVGRAVEFILLN